MKIDEKRHLVVPVVTEQIIKQVDGKDVAEEVVRIHAYHTPISHEVWEQNYRALAAAKAALFSKGAHYTWSVAPRIAALTLKDEGKKEGVRDEEIDALLSEIKRLTLILCPGPHGWDMLPVDTAIAQGKIDAEDWRETLSVLVFFTCVYAMARKADRETTAAAFASPISALITSLSTTEYVASLPNSMQAAPTTPAPSSTQSFPM